jgi:hypothetical protein
MNGLRTICHCGHDRDTHYVDQSCQPSARVSCLAGGCDCTKYVNESEPKPTKIERPKHAWHCRCFDCKAYSDAQDRKTTGTFAAVEPPPSSDFNPFNGF